MSSARVGCLQGLSYDFIMRVKYDNSAGDHDFRVNVFANANNTEDDYVQVLIPWEGGDSRVDRVIDGLYDSHYYTGGPYIYGTSVVVDVTCKTSPSVEVYRVDTATLVIPETSTDKYGNYIHLTMDTDDTVYVDWITVRKYSSSPPSISYSSEESGSWTIDGHVFTKRKKVTITASQSVEGYQVRLSYSQWNDPNLRILHRAIRYIRGDF